MKTMMSGRWGPVVSLLLTPCLFPGAADAKPSGASAFCQVYPEVPACTAGAADCQTCHTVPPARNLFGAQLEANLLPAQARPLSEESFLQALPGALRAISPQDADADGASNLQELRAGTDPSDAADIPRARDLCQASDVSLRSFNVCGFDAGYTYKKVMLDFCGRSPTADERDAFLAQPDPKAELRQVLERCMDSDYWRGKDGAVWNLANAKIAPNYTLKTGEDADPEAIVTFSNYYDDYHFFVHAHTDGRDVRELLTGQYLVRRMDASNDAPTRYERYQANALDEIQERGFPEAQFVEPSKRAGMLTHRWFLMSTVMFSALPRTTAAQAYRAYLGLDISKLEGLQQVPQEPRDYDSKAVDAPECAVCHSTLDPLTYPFTRYEGLGGGDGFRGPARYTEDRVTYFTGVEGERVSQTPEAGVILGEPVEDLVAWAQVAANSQEFAYAVVADYWQLLFGESPRDAELLEYTGLADRLVDEHGYSVEAMLYELIFTEAYSVP